MRRDADDGEGGAIEPDDLAENGRISGEAPLPVVFADEYGGRCSEFRRAHRVEGAAAQGVDSKNREVVFGDLDCGGELRIDGAGGKQSQFSQQRASGRTALGAARSRKDQPVTAVGDHAAEGMKIASICLVVGIAEIVFGIAGLANQRDVDHLAGIASVERAGKHRFVDR